MADVTILLSNKTLEKFVEGLEISAELKEKLKAKIPNLDLQERKDFFRTLCGIYLLGLEEKEELDYIDKYWK